MGVPAAGAGVRLGHDVLAPADGLHARFTFRAGGHATWRQHAQSTGSAAYAVTCAAVLCHAA